MKELRTGFIPAVCAALWTFDYKVFVIYCELRRCPVTLSGIEAVAARSTSGANHHKSVETLQWLIVTH